MREVDYLKRFLPLVNPQTLEKGVEEEVEEVMIEVVMETIEIREGMIANNSKIQKGI